MAYFVDLLTNDPVMIFQIEHGFGYGMKQGFGTVWYVIESNCSLERMELR